MRKKPQLTASYIVLDKLELIIHVYQGVGSSKGMLAYIHHLMADLDPKSINYAAIVDSRNMNWDFLVSEVNDYVDGLTKLEGIISKKRKMAGVYNASSPHQMFYTKIHHQKLKAEDQTEGYFANITDAISWLEKEIDPAEAEEIIAKISKTPQFKWYGE